MQVDIKAHIEGRIHKAPDLEMHVRTLEVDGEKFVEFRDFVPSLNEYRRGYWVPNDRAVLVQIIESLLPLAEEK